MEIFGEGGFSAVSQFLNDPNRTIIKEVMVI